MVLRGDPDGIAPERALVFEVVGSVSDFYAQTRRTPGLEFLLDQDVEFAPDDDFHNTRVVHEEVHRLERAVGGRLYMAMPDLQALRQLLSLWSGYQRGERHRGFAAWNQLFSQLRDLRAWGPRDRMLPATIEYLRGKLQDTPGLPVRLEAEFWYHDDLERRIAAATSIERYLDGVGGQVVSSASLEPIRYHAVLIDLPPREVQELVDNVTIGLARVDDVMYLKPQSLAVSPIEPTAEGTLEEGEGARGQGPIVGRPLIALLDGVPLANHLHLVGRILLDDPDDLEAASPVAKRSHGTSMASLIAHGDLNAATEPLRSPLYVQPVMTFDPQSNSETTPKSSLPLDVIYRAVLRMKEPLAAGGAVAESVVVVNLSLGDLNRAFSGLISAWARLIDWLSFRYRILFVVSSGNTLGWLPIPDYANRGELLAADVVERENKILVALDTLKAQRTLLSPSEALNCITVGAWHDEAGPTAIPIALIDPFPNGAVPNLSSALGLGYRRTIKPDLVYDGGREFVQVSEDEGHVWLRAYSDGRSSGQRSAAADSDGRGRLNLTQRSCGTSNATALMTRSCALIMEGLADSGYEIPATHQAVTLKALLIHGATWGATGEPA